MPSEKLHVIVVGAGLAGLAIAHGLEKKGISYTIVDREVAPRDRNWAVTLSWSDPLLKELLPAELYNNLQACQPDPHRDNRKQGTEFLLIRDGSTGEAKMKVRYPGIRRMQILKTKTIWKQGLDIKYGRKLTDIEMTNRIPTARFEDGTTEASTIIIGADGGASRVRRWLLGDLANQEVLPYVFMNFSFNLPADEAIWLDSVMNPNVDVATHPSGTYCGLFLLDKTDVEKPETWTFYILATWPFSANEEERPENRLAKLREHMKDWADPYKRVVNALPENVLIKPDQLRIWHPKPWDSYGGKVTLAGDAAHSMTFHRGQGGNLAIKDAYEFVAAMGRVQAGTQSLEDAIAEYDRGVVERGAEVEISKAQAVAFHDYATFDQSPVFSLGLEPVSS